MSYVIVKSTRIYQGGNGYSGPSCDLAGVKHGNIYRYFCEAVNDAEKLQNVNGVGWVVHTYFPLKVFEAKV